MRHRLVKYLQKKMHAVNERNIEKTEEMFGPFKSFLNVQYGKRFPNSYIDIYLCGAKTLDCPTLFYVHGGGFTWGDKRTGDPNGGSDSFLWYFDRFLKEGFNIVSFNYAFAPEFQYPTPVIQMGEAVRFLKNNGDKYGIGMKKVVFAGSSAGGQIIGQFVNIQTNPEYAKKIKIEPSMNQEEIRGVVFNSALLDMQRFGETGFFISDWLFTKCGRAYFDVKKLSHNENVMDARVIPYVTKLYPPTFISDANTASFYKQAFELNEKMNRMGVVHKFNFYEKSEKKLMHGFENTDDYYGQDNMDKMIEFLKENKLTSGI